MDTSQVDEEFDWDSLNNDENKELWIVRIPEGLKLKHLDGLEIPQLESSQGDRLYSLERKRAKYDIWSVDSSRADPSQDENDERPSRGEEMKTLTCLLPRKKKKGKLYIAPKDISQHIIITHAPAVVNTDDATAPTPSTRDSVPKHLLKHRFVPYGAASLDVVSRAAEVMDVDAPKDEARNGNADGEIENTPAPAEQATTPKKHSQSPEKGGKKRKNAAGESETPNRKLKKLKV
ncbi:hypothetical protein K439DRAFT_1612496 [Ramaria rubella]|nr:hypothetical protein K439DRAFT_1612496 [Ramaria rubella]